MHMRRIGILADTHHVKILTLDFEDIKNGVRKFDVRKNDSDYKVGDTLILEEINPNTGKYTGRWTPQLIVYKFYDKQFITPGNVILGLQEIKY